MPEIKPAGNVPPFPAPIIKSVPDGSLIDEQSGTAGGNIAVFAIQN